MALNYLGPQVGPSGPITNQLPAAGPGTMQDAVPGISSTPAPLPPTKFHSPPGGQHANTPIMQKGSGHTPSSALAAIMRHATTPGGPLAQLPPKAQFKAMTQDDGTILLHRVNPNGSLGPVVKVIPAPKAAAH